MKHEGFHSCDICGRSFAAGAAVRGAVSVYSSRGSIIYSDVCDECADAVAELLVLTYPKSKAIIRPREGSVPAVCKDRDCGRCIRCAQDEDTAVEMAA
jgi:hypothetical protein